MVCAFHVSACAVTGWVHFGALLHAQAATGIWNEPPLTQPTNPKHRNPAAQVIFSSGLMLSSFKRIDTRREGVMRQIEAGNRWGAVRGAGGCALTVCATEAGRGADRAFD